MNLVKLYERLISNAENNNGKPIYSYCANNHRKNRKEGYDIHHIKPRSIGGNDEPCNLVYLTYREHYTAHHILALLHGGKLSSAWLRFINRKNYPVKITSRQYKTMRELISIARKGRKHTEEAKIKCGNAHKGNKYCVGRVLSEETKEKIRNKLKGVTFTDERKAALKIVRQGQNKGVPKSEAHKLALCKSQENMEMLTCPHCGKTMRKNNAMKYHFDNCVNVTGIKHTNKTGAKECPRCKKMIGLNSFNRWHGDNCRAVNDNSLIELRQKGLTYKAIAESVGLSEATVFTQLKKCGY